MKYFTRDLPNGRILIYRHSRLNPEQEIEVAEVTDNTSECIAIWCALKNLTIWQCLLARIAAKLGPTKEETVPAPIAEEPQPEPPAPWQLCALHDNTREVYGRWVSTGVTMMARKSRHGQWTMTLYRVRLSSVSSMMIKGDHRDTTAKMDREELNRYFMARNPVITDRRVN